MPEAPAPPPPSVTMANPETGELVAVPAAQARDLYLSGKLGFVEGESVPISVGGKTEFLPADQAGRALETSFTANVKGTAQAQRATGAAPVHGQPQRAPVQQQRPAAQSSGQQVRPAAQPAQGQQRPASTAPQQGQQGQQRSRGPQVQPQQPMQPAGFDADEDIPF